MGVKGQPFFFICSSSK